MVFVFVVMAPITQNMNLNVKVMMPLASENTAANVILALQVTVVPNKSLTTFYRSPSWFKYIADYYAQQFCSAVVGFNHHFRSTHVVLPSTKFIVIVLLLVVVLLGMILTFRWDRERNVCTISSFVLHQIWSHRIMKQFNKLSDFCKTDSRPPRQNCFSINQ